MSDLVQRALDLIKEGTLPVMLPLTFVCLVMWVAVAERIHFLFGSVWSVLWPPARRRMESLKALLAESLDEYLEQPTVQNRRTLLGVCQKALTPYARFLIRAVGPSDFASDRYKDLRLGAASLESENEIARGLLLISTLAKAAPLLGLLGTVTGMIQTFRVMMFASTSDPRSLSSGISIALIATEVGLVVSLTGVVSSSWLNRRAQTILEEIRVAGMRLIQGAAPRGRAA